MRALNGCSVGPRLTEVQASSIAVAQGAPRPRTTPQKAKNMQESTVPEIRPFAFTAGSPEDPRKGQGHCLICPSRMVDYQAATNLWVDVAGQSHTGHQIELREPTAKTKLIKTLAEFSRETDIYEICEAYSTVIKRDLATIAISFLGLLLTYTDRNQIVIQFKADSSTGKSYIPIEIVMLFPNQDTDILKLAGASPTSFIHEANAQPI